MAEAHTSLAKHKNQIERELESVMLTTHTQATQNNKPAPTELLPPPGFLIEDGCLWGTEEKGKVERVGTAMGRGGGFFCGPSAKTDFFDPPTERNSFERLPSFLEGFGRVRIGTECERVDGKGGEERLRRGYSDGRAQWCSRGPVR